MICYRDMTFCVNEQCTKKCGRYLTCEIEQAAKGFEIPVAVASFICLNQGEDGIYRHESEVNQ